MNLDLRRRIFSRRHRDALRLSHQHRAHIIKLMPVKHRRLHFPRVAPIHAPQIHQHPDRIARPCQHARRHLICRRRLPARRRQPLHRIHLLPAFIQVHLILQAGQIRTFAVRIKLVVQLKHHPVGILRMRERLQMPRILPLNIPPLSHFHSQIRHRAVELGYIGDKVQRLPGPRLKSHRPAARSFDPARRSRLRFAGRPPASRLRLVRSHHCRRFSGKQRLRLGRFVPPIRPNATGSQAGHNQQPHSKFLPHTVCATLLIFSASACRSHRTIR